MLRDVFPDADFQWQMRVQRRDIRAFYLPGPEHGEILAERNRWLDRDPDIHARLVPAGTALLEETLDWANSLGALPAGAEDRLRTAAGPLEHCRLLGRLWEPDFLLLKSDGEGAFRLMCGCVCFPSHWSLEEKMGRTLGEIHVPVPHLNPLLGRRIDAFLAGIKPGVSWERVNWGLSRSPERNQHPRRSLPRLDETVGVDDVWLRIEQQSLVRLPISGGILFGIRIVQHPLETVRTDPTAKRRLVRALETMPPEVAAYKGLARARRRLVSLLGEVG